MLQDTDLFDKLPDFSYVGGDVSCSVEWQETPSPDERYTIGLTWKYRNNTCGTASYIIEPISDAEFRIFWIGLEFIEEWQHKGLSTTLFESYADHLPEYGIKSIVVALRDKEHEAELAEDGFAWVGHEFVLSLLSPSED